MNTNPAPREIASTYEIENALATLVREVDNRIAMESRTAKTLNPADEIAEFHRLNALILDDKATAEDIANAMEIIENMPEATDDLTFSLYLDISNMSNLEGEIVEFIALEAKGLHTELNDSTEILNNLIEHFTEETTDEIVNTVLNQLEMLEA